MRRTIAGTKRGAKPKPAVKKAVKKVAAKKRNLTAQQRAAKRITALRNLGIHDAKVMKRAEQEAKLTNLSLEEHIAKKEASIAENKTIAEMRGEVERLCKEHDYNPLKELIVTAKKGKLKPSEKISIDKYLGNKMVPDVKAVDIQADMNMNVRVTIQSFAGATEAVMKEAHKVAIDLVDEDYEEFEVLEGETDE